MSSDFPFGTRMVSFSHQNAKLWTLHQVSPPPLLPSQVMELVIIFAAGGPLCHGEFPGGEYGEGRRQRKSSTCKNHCCC